MFQFLHFDNFYGYIANHTNQDREHYKFYHAF